MIRYFMEYRLIVSRLNQFVLNANCHWKDQLKHEKMFYLI